MWVFLINKKLEQAKDLSIQLPQGKTIYLKVKEKTRNYLVKYINIRKKLWLGILVNVAQ